MGYEVDLPFIHFTFTAWQILVVKLLVILTVVPVGALVGGYALHKELGHLQHRLGPMYAGGFHGWAQTLADGIKFIYKEDIIPASADKRVFKLAPAVIFVPVMLLFLVIPIDRSLIVEDLDVGIFYLLAIGSVGVDRHADGRMVIGEQVRADRCAACGRTADRLRAADRADRRRCRDARRNAVDGRHRRGPGLALHPLATRHRTHRVPGLPRPARSPR